MEPQFGSQKPGWALNPEEHIKADELINELQDRLEQLQNRRDDTVSLKREPWGYKPDLYTIKVGDDRIVIKKGLGQVVVSHNGKMVVQITGMNLDLIDFQGFTTAMIGIRSYMVLDDLADV